MNATEEALEKLQTFLLGRKRLPSPIGAKEYTAGPLDKLRFFNDDIYAVTLPDETVLYREEDKDLPTVQRHERIHVGQTRLGNKIPKDEIEKIFDLSAFRHKNNKSIDPRYRHMEHPAYELSDYRTMEETPKEHRPTQQMRNDERVIQAMNYLNLLRRRKANERGIATIEASTNPDLLKRLMKLTGPEPPKAHGSRTG